MFLALIVLPPLMVYLAWYIPGVPRYFAQKITDSIGEKYNIDLKVDYLYFVPPRSLTFKGITLKQANSDSVLYISKFAISLTDFSFAEKSLTIGRVAVTDGHLLLSSDSAGLNVQPLLDSFKTVKDSSSSEWTLKFKTIRLKGCRFSYSNQLKPDTVVRFNPAHLDLDNINLTIDSIVQHPDSMVLKLKHLAFKDKSGLVVSRAKAEMGLGKHGFLMKDVWLSTLYSSFEADSLSLRYNSVDDFSDFYNKVNIAGSVKHLILAPSDLHLVTPLLPGFHQTLLFSGDVSGKVSKLKGRGIKLQYGSSTGVEANFDVDGLPTLSETFLFLDIINLQTDIEDIQKILGKDSITPLILPPNLRKLGVMSYKGNFTGFFNDLVAYGVFNTNIGEITTDMGFKLKEDNSIFYSGAFKSKRLNVGTLINQEGNLNRLSLDLTVNGGWSPSGNYLAYLDGNIDSILYNSYKYHRLNIKGLFTQRQFDGELEINDPNGYLNFNGRVDLSSKVPVFDFVAEVKEARLDRLKLTPDLKNSNLSFRLESNFEGDNIDNLIGSVKLTNASLYSDRDDIDINKLIIQSSMNGDVKKITCNSNLFDAEIVGQFKLNDFLLGIKKDVNGYIPSLFEKEAKQMGRTKNIFTFKFNSKHITPIFNIFTPGYQLSDTLFCYGSVNSSTMENNISLEINRLNTPGVEINKLFMRLKTNRQKAILNTLTNRLKVGESFVFDNFTINNQAAQDSLVTNLFWNNWEGKKNSASFYTSTSFKTLQSGDVESFVHLLPSKFMINNSAWQMLPATFKVSSVGVDVDGFLAQNGEQMLSVNGSVYKNGGDELKLLFSNLNLAYLTTLEDISGAKFGGILNGYINFKELLVSPYFLSDLSIDDFVFNDDFLGHFQLNSLWSKENQAIDIEAKLHDGEKQPLYGKGWIYPKENKMDVDFVLDKFKIGFLDFYLGDILQNLHGTTSGNIKVDGPLNGPGLTGSVHADDIHFDVDLMKTHYYIRDSVYFTPNEMRFDNMTVVDQKNNSAKFWGSIHHTLFWDYKYDLHVKGQNMFVLNTTKLDNPLYYGTVYADGTLDIEGTNDNLIMNIGGKTRQGTKFFIPLQETEEAEESKFIRFTTSTTVTRNKKFSSDDYQVNISGLNLTINAEITPEAQTQIIFNSTSGDILESKGKGNIQVRIDQDGKVSFYGNYLISDGDYLFTLNNLMNKKFKINEGGTVQWTGDPYNAEINIKAIYKLKASLSDLYGSSAADVTSTTTSRRIPINCNLLLTENLQHPTIRFDIETPSIEQNRNFIHEFITTEEEMNKQFISLLVLNRFFTPEYLRNVDETASRSNETNALVTTTTELLTGQLSLWLSQINKDVDVGVIYRPGDEITSEEMAISLSTQMFNDRVTLNGTTGYSRSQSSTSALIGDFDVDVKLNPSGTLSWKAYTKTNDNITYDNSPTTQGTGITYREEFNNFKELIQKYWGILFNRKEDEENADSD